VQADVALADQLSQALDEARTSLPPLRGVLHAAGLLDDGVVAQQTPERFNRVMAPKVAGAWNLHLLTQRDALDFFVMYSSAASLLGSPGQSNHAAANAFLDGLAHFRRAAGLPAQSINWGAWSGIGEAARRQAGERLGAKGVGAISPEQGLKALERLWNCEQAQAAFVPIDWPQFLPHWPDRALVAGFRAEPDERPTESSLRSIIDGTPAHGRVEVVTNFVAGQVARILGLEAAADVDPEAGFFSLGMDSLTSVELKNRLQSELGCTLPATVVFDFPNVEALTRFVLTDVLRLGLDEAGKPEPAQAVGTTDGFDDLSEAELADLLSSKLRAMN